MGRPDRSQSFCAALMAILLGCGLGMVSARERVTSVAVFPVENLTRDSIPAADVRQFLIGRLEAEGVSVLADDVLEAFMARHRVRYQAGIDTATAMALRQETGVDGVVFASVELASQAAPAKVALFARIVSVAATPVVVWADDIGIAGDDEPGLFDLGVANDYEVVQQRAFDRLGASLTAYLRTGRSSTDLKSASKFRPRAQYRNVTLEADRPYSVLVVPFFNVSERRHAGEIMALHFIRHLSSLPRFRVIDPGAARQQQLDARIIMDGGLSIRDAETLAVLVEADFVLAGRVLRYEDYEGPVGRTGVEFSAVLIDPDTRRVVWSSGSYNEGSEGAGLFERGVSRTAHVMATQMVGITAELIAGRGQ